MNTNHDDSAPRLDPEQEWRMVTDCILATDLMIKMNGGVLVSAAMFPLFHASVREELRKHYCDRYMVKFGTDDDPTQPYINLFPNDGGLEEEIEVSASSTEDKTEEVAVKAMAAGA